MDTAANLVDILTIAGIVLAALVALGLILARLYRRASKEVSFVRTGLGGQKVIINGGAIVLPVVHEVIPVNMNTLRLEVRRSAEHALITHDRMRVDVTAEFYVRAKPTGDAIADAAQTLGRKTMNPEELKELVEGKFVDALRAVAAEMAMEELHEKRVDFVHKVQQVVSEDLLKNGLELESVSLTGLDQTAFEHFNPQNAFDAEGLTRLTEAIETRRRMRNEIEQDTEVDIRRKNLEAETQKLEIDKETEYAKLAQEREVAVRKAQQNATIASEEAEKSREAQQAEIAAKRQVELARVEAERAVQEEQIVIAETLRSREIAKDRSLETAEVERRKTVELAEQDREIAIAERSRSQSEAQAEAAKARALAVREDENVVTVREVEQAERKKQVELVEAKQVAEQDAISVTVAADAEKQAALDAAEAKRTRAEAIAAERRITAQAEADAELSLVEVAERRYAVDSAGQRAVNEASNVLSAEQIAMQVRMALLEQLPAIIRESVKPMEQIDGIRIMQVEGIGGAGGSGGAGGDGSTGGGNLADNVVDSALRYRAQGPIVDALLSELGLEGGSVKGLSGGLVSAAGGGGEPDAPQEVSAD